MVVHREFSRRETGKKMVTADGPWDGHYEGFDL